MEETKKTLVFAGVAVALVLLAFIFSPKRITPESFLDQGEPFFPEFTDPNEATTLEVIEYDETTGSPRPFKVTFENGRWTIPSHHNYPADARDQLAQTAAGVIQIRKDDYRSDNVSDHEAFGVIDPLEESAGLAGRGRRVTIKSSGGNVLADFIIGNEVEGRENIRFVRVPDQKRVYAARVDLELSTRFEDWINTDLLEVTKAGLEQVVINDYSINERTRSVERRGSLELNKEDGKWQSPAVSSGRMLDTAAVNELLTTLDSLTIVGVRPKPEGLSQSLKQDEASAQVSQSDLMSLQSKGFFFTRDGQLMSNEGELIAYASNGVKYTLRFGEVVYGSGLALTAGITGDEADGQQEGGENRYLFVTTEFDESRFPEPPRPSDEEFLKKPDSLLTEADRENKNLHSAYETWKRKVERGRERSQELNEHYSDWYYVISSEDFEKLHPSRSDLIVAKTEES